MLRGAPRLAIGDPTARGLLARRHAGLKENIWQRAYSAERVRQKDLHAWDLTIEKYVCMSEREASGLSSVLLP